MKVRELMDLLDAADPEGVIRAKTYNDDGPEVIDIDFATETTTHAVGEAPVTEVVLG